MQANLRHEGPRRRQTAPVVRGDRNTPSWSDRQEVPSTSRLGAFLALRNVAAHADAVTWAEQKALEPLATLSVLARWIERCIVERGLGRLFRILHDDRHEHGSM
ncbi:MULTISPECIES: TIGR02391 family protein [unclassified Streptomyces]|uniref:TIGR02391 family protein n=1 Tax=unclassified Streptomyces TaxID=2593676 RepID=UPI00283AA34E|nr:MULTISPECIES: TIGR02391 family protein [unclassified Streptomyces]